ncbi:unnamed protein product, partial [Dicrocoelium dendriticum]
VESNRTFCLSEPTEALQLIASSVYRNSRSVWIRLSCLPYGRYIIVPTTFYPNCYTDFLLRVVGPPPIVMFKLARLQPPCHRDTRLSRSRSVLQLEREKPRFDSVRHRLRDWIHAVCPLHPTTNCLHLMSSFISRPVRVTVVQATIWPSSTAFVALHDDRGGLSSFHYYYYIRILFRSSKTLSVPVSLCSGVHRMTVLRGPRPTGLIRFEEVFLFPPHSLKEEITSLEAALFIYNPAFDELHSHCTVAVDTHLKSGSMKHILLSPHLGRSAVFAWKRSNHHPSSMRVFTRILEPKNPLHRDKNHSFRAAFRLSEDLLSIEDATQMRLGTDSPFGLSNGKITPSESHNTSTAYKSSCGVLTLFFE